MKQLPNPVRIPVAWLGIAPLALLALLPPQAQFTSQRVTGVVARVHPPDPVGPRLPEAPPAHPPAAPCGECSAGCGSGPRGIANVYLHSGEVHLREVDLVIPGRGLDFVWARTYRSRIGPNTEQGNGWDFSYNVKIAMEGSAVRVMDGGGRSDLYRRRSDGTYAAAELFREGMFNPDGTFDLMFGDQGTWSFFQLDGSPFAGKVRMITDRSGNSLAFDYDGLGRLTLVVDTLGRQIQIAHDGAGRITSLTDFLGRQVRYSYYAPPETGGSLGDLKSARSPLVTGTPNGNDFPAGKTKTYTYSRGFADERSNHNLLTVTDPKGQTWLVNAYSSELDPNGLLFDRVVRQTRGSLGDNWDISYELVDLGTSMGVLAIVNDAVGNVGEYEYDLLGRCVTQRALTGRANPDLATTRTTNRPMNPLRSTDPAFFETRWTYNADSRATEVVHPNGNVTQNVYELELDPMAAPRARGNLRERRRLPGTHTPVGDQAMLSELFEYDTAFAGCCGTNFVTRHTDARGNVTQHVYDPAGNRIQTRHRIPSIVEDFTYNAFGQMTSRTWPDNGASWRQVDLWTYYGAVDGPQNGYLRTEIQDANGFALTTRWTYDAAGNATQVTDARGNVTTMVVNALNQAVRQTSPPVQMLNGVMAQYQVDTWFDANDNVVRQDTKNFDALGNVAANAWLTTSFEHEILNREIRKREEVDATRDVVTEYEYDANRSRTLTRFGEATLGNKPTNVERLLFDERNLLFQKIRAEGDAQQSTVQFDYDANGSLVRVARGLEGAAPRIRTSIVDAYGRTVAETDPMGNASTKNYDPNGNCVHERIDGELCDEPGSAGNVRLFEATHVYDAMDRRVESRVEHFDPATGLPIGDGLSRSAWTWTDRSEVATVTDDNGYVTTHGFDSAGRRAIVTDAKGNMLQTVFDANHNVVQVVESERPDSGGPDQVFLTMREWDELDRQVRETDSLGNVSRMGYDSRDNTARIVDALGNLTTQTFDGLRRLLGSTRVLTATGTGSGHVVGQIVRAWSWDDSSRLVTQTDDNGNVTAYTYDALGRRVLTLLADGGVETVEHDAHDNVVRRIDPNGTRVDSTFDLSNRLRTRAILPAVGVSTDTTFEIWKYDGFSRLVQAEDDDSVVLREWDSHSNRTRETQNGMSFVCTHDGMRNELGVTYPSGKLVTCTYDALNRQKTITNAGLAARYDYVGPRRVERRIAGPGLLTSLYGYDGARRTTSVAHFAGAASAVDRRSFQWDAMYNKTRSTDVLSGDFNEYFYDSQYRLIRAKDTDPGIGVLRDVLYAIDGVGNRVSVAGGSCAGAYVMDPVLPEPADDVMNQYTNTPCIGCIEYDHNGNQVARGAGEALTYDYRDRLVRHQGPNGLTSFAYDALGRNIAKLRSSASETVRYYYHGLDVLEERDGSGALRAAYVRGRSTSGYDDPLLWMGFNPQPDPPVTHEIVERNAGGQLHYFLGDDLGSVRAVTDDLGAVVERYGYDEAGAPSFFDGVGTALPGSAIGNAWLFTGQRRDAETGFYNYNRRFMDPLLGQFLSRDPLGLWGDAVNLGNGRTYVANNFQTLVDPTGMYSKACGGPWPGPKNVYYGYVDCGSNFTIPDALCRAMRGAGRADRAANTWVTYELTGYPGGWSWLAAVPFQEWFAGPNNSIDPIWMLVISTTLKTVWEPFRKGKAIWIECESSCDANVNAYIAWYDSNVHLCPRWWNLAANQRGSVILHELSHELADTEDYFYHFSQTKASTQQWNGMELPNIWPTPVLAQNADTYEGLWLKWFVQ